MASILKKSILTVIGPRIAPSVRVAAVQNLGKHFRFVDLEMAAPGGQPWGPADKVQLNTGAWDVRTYTPIRLHPDANMMRLLVYLHGNGPGSLWASNVKPGHTVHRVGPKAALAVGEGPLVLVGDETSFGTAYNLKDHHDVHFIFEATSPKISREALAALAIHNATVVEKTDNGSHLAEMANDVHRHMGLKVNMKLVLTGNAQTIQSIMRALKSRGLAKSQMQSKPYWANNKVGLD